ncbi:hypothetical protein ACIQNG_08455 [Streptomyces sp. NPDC091377]|uniref:hypothetical protein n=1 Tax=Streptomyces sp. NPDC091377 TaxID=3365995 RepID=UPI0038284A27
MIEHVGPPAPAPPVGDLYHPLAIVRSGCVVAVAGQIGVRALGRPAGLIEVDGPAVVPAHSPLTQDGRRAPAGTEEDRSTT